MDPYFMIVKTIRKKNLNDGTINRKRFYVCMVPY